jgi:hypothetical protein
MSINPIAVSKFSGTLLARKLTVPINCSPAGNDVPPKEKMLPGN